MSFKIHADSHSLIGYDHLVCQDYTLTEKDVSWLSDGCSGALHSDIGARLLIHSIKTNNEYSPIIYNTLLNLLGLDKSVLSATLGRVYVDNGYAIIDLIGDGVLFFKFKNNSIVIIDVDFPDNVPFYPLYSIYETYGYDYYAKGHGKNIITQTIIGEYNSSIIEETIVSGKRFKVPLDNISMFGLSSDGIKTGNISYIKAIEELISVPIPLGLYIKRKMRKMHKSNLFKHSDDWSVAAISIESV